MFQECLRIYALVSLCSSSFVSVLFCLFHRHERQVEGRNFKAPKDFAMDSYYFPGFSQGISHGNLWTTLGGGLTGGAWEDLGDFEQAGNLGGLWSEGWAAMGEHTKSIPKS